MTHRTLGTCYYPEHWPEDWWEDDARRMVAAGLTWVRIGEFAWSRIEPAPGQLDWGWLDRALDVLGGAGLRVVLGTPTATPPRWMLDRHPEMLAVGADGRPRGPRLAGDRRADRSQRRRRPGSCVGGKAAGGLDAAGGGPYHPLSF